MRNGLPRVRQHLVPVVPAQALGADPHAADSDDLVVAHPEEETKGPPGVGDQTCSQKGGPPGSGTLPSRTQSSEGPRGVSGRDALPSLLGWTVDTDR